MTSMAPGTVMVTSIIGIPPRAISSTAKRASSPDEVRITGTIPTSSTLARRVALSIDDLLSGIQEETVKLQARESTPALYSGSMKISAEWLRSLGVRVSDRLVTGVQYHGDKEEGQEDKTQDG